MQSNKMHNQTDCITTDCECQQHSANVRQHSSHDIPTLVERLTANSSTAHPFVVSDAGHDKTAFRRFSISDVVFLAIMSACMLLSGAVMPLITQVPLFGIIQLCLGLQFSIFPAIGLMKVRKIGALCFMALFSGIVLIFMFPPMFVCLIACAIIAELLTIVLFRNYSKNIACAFASALYMPLTLPFLYVWITFFYTTQDKAEAGQAVNAYVGGDVWLSIAMSVAVVAVCVVGATVGVKIAKELKKAGVIKK